MTSPVPTDDQAVIVRAADAEVLGHPAFLTVQLLADASASDGAMSVVQCTLAGGVDGARPHHHAHSAELFYVLDGEVEVLAGERVARASKGDLVIIPHHMAHAFGSLPGSTAELLIVVAPGIERFEYFRTLERIAYGTVPADSLLAQQERYDTWFLESSAWQDARART